MVVRVCGEDGGRRRLGLAEKMVVDGGYTQTFNYFYFNL